MPNFDLIKEQAEKNYFYHTNRAAFWRRLCFFAILSKKHDMKASFYYAVYFTIQMEAKGQADA